MAQRHGGGRREARRDPHRESRRSPQRDPARQPDGAARRQPRPASVSGTGPPRPRLREIIDPVVSAAGYDVEGLALSRAGRRHLVRLIVDGDDGVSLDAVAEVSRRVSVALDEVEAGGEELFAGEYELQVSSPGVDRPLSLPRHWRRSVNRLVQVRAADRQVTGRILAADDSGVTLDIGGERRRVRYGELGPGRIQLEFTRLAALSDAELEDMLDPVDDDGTGDDDTDAPRSAEDDEEEDQE